jgi:hypothetical protein
MYELPCFISLFSILICIPNTSEIHNNSRIFLNPMGHGRIALHAGVIEGSNQEVGKKDDIISKDTV